MPNQLTLFPMETEQYNSWLMQELLNNCIAHTNYQLWDKLPDALSDAQKEYKVSNLLAALKKNNIIDTDSSNQQRSSWILKQ